VYKFDRVDGDTAVWRSGGSLQAWRHGDLEGRCGRGDAEARRHGGLEGIATRIRWSRTATTKVSRERGAAVRCGGDSKVWRQRQASVAAGARVQRFDFDEALMELEGLMMG
jgi:hypothetical protein